MELVDSVTGALLLLGFAIFVLVLYRTGRLQKVRKRIHSIRRTIHKEHGLNDGLKYYQVRRWSLCKCNLEILQQWTLFCKVLIIDMMAGYITGKAGFVGFYFNTSCYHIDYDNISLSKMCKSYEDVTVNSEREAQPVDGGARQYPSRNSWVGD